jgi:hypothetical protein
MGRDRICAIALVAFLATLAGGASAEVVLRRSVFAPAGRAGNRTVVGEITVGEPVAAVSTGPSLVLWHGFLGPLGLTPTAVLPAEAVGVSLKLLSSNPSGGPVLISYRQALGRSGTVSIYDVRGRRVRQLATESVAGEGSFLWHLDDEEGARIVAGLYFIQYDVGGVRLVRRIVALP